MIDRTALESRLRNWAEEYGGSKYANVGWPGQNMIQTLVEHKGFVPDSRGFIPVPIRSQADEVETVVREMEQGDYMRQAKVLRCDYFHPGMAIDARLYAMRRIGLGISRTAYYDLLAQAKAMVAGALSTAKAA
ncbi:hypothetical protein [Lysobacter enzymogenes]|uniref:hypothetical protein n=1 Tax=Lysobacter enzymogenes TaxID=69 RepID=UPI000894847F|nr:hypothetical protein [Lysobacter enzymogenes]SDX52404.1 hypothetical protein SAMN05421681_10615 [Lysobacter enzymogenes]